jgi:dihydrofolate reductase
MRKIIAALHISLDGCIEDANGDVGWIESWEDAFDVVPRVDTFLLGGGMYPGYEDYWGAVFSHPSEPAPFSGKIPAAGEVDYARFAHDTPHVVLSNTLRQVSWPNSRIIRDIADVHALKQAAGKYIHAVGGARLVGSLLNAGLVDELTVVVQPLLLGGGKALFGDVTGRHGLALQDVRKLGNGAVQLTYTL